MVNNSLGVDSPKRILIIIATTLTDDLTLKKGMVWLIKPPLGFLTISQLKSLAPPLSYLVMEMTMGAMGIGTHETPILEDTVKETTAIIGAISTDHAAKVAIAIGTPVETDSGQL
jgi:hypothetical protein